MSRLTITIRGEILSDPWFIGFLQMAWATQSSALWNPLASCGYRIIEIMDKEEKEIMEDDEFIDQVDTYAIYKAMSEVDGIVDIAQRIGPDDDPYEVQEAVQEILRLAESAIQYLETVTGDSEDEDFSDEDALYGEGEGEEDRNE